MSILNTRPALPTVEAILNAPVVTLMRTEGPQHEHALRTHDVHEDGSVWVADASRLSTVCRGCAYQWRAEQHAVERTRP